MVLAVGVMGMVVLGWRCCSCDVDVGRGGGVGAGLVLVLVSVVRTAGVSVCLVLVLRCGVGGVRVGVGGGGGGGWGSCWFGDVGFGFNVPVERLGKNARILWRLTAFHPAPPLQRPSSFRLCSQIPSGEDLEALNVPSWMDVCAKVTTLAP